MPGKRIGGAEEVAAVPSGTALPAARLRAGGRTPLRNNQFSSTASVGHFLGFDGDSFAGNNLQHIMQNFLDVR